MEGLGPLPPRPCLASSAGALVGWGKNRSRPFVNMGSWLCEVPIWHLGQRLDLCFPRCRRSDTGQQSGRRGNRWHRRFSSACFCFFLFGLSRGWWEYKLAWGVRRTEGKGFSARGAGERDYAGGFLIVKKKGGTTGTSLEITNRLGNQRGERGDLSPKGYFEGLHSRSTHGTEL